MVVGILSRDSVREAYAKGITADQIISYLTNHAHPEMFLTPPVVPSTVIDQIRLWEMEMNRLQTHDGYLYQMFNRFADYAQVKKFADDFGYVRWYSDEKMMFFVSAEGHEHVKGYIKQKGGK
jgi:transcription initiation factor TFIIH subunit 4